MDWIRVPVFKSMTRDEKIRNLAVQAAGAYCSGGGFGGAENVVPQAVVFETYIRKGAKPWRSV